MKLSNAKVAGISLTVFAAMLGLGFSAERFTAHSAGSPDLAAQPELRRRAPKEILDQEITVRFDANVADTAADLPTSPARPEGQDRPARSCLLRGREPTRANPIRVIASYNVTPHYCGAVFL
jgi:cytochrome c oxidase assembly protein subunit 11